VYVGGHHYPQKMILEILANIDEGAGTNLDHHRKPKYFILSFLCLP
jgi:hypothetical protein